jgi:hypothetical protein
MNHEATLKSVSDVSVKESGGRHKTAGEWNLQPRVSRETKAMIEKGEPTLKEEGKV